MDSLPPDIQSLLDSWFFSCVQVVLRNNVRDLHHLLSSLIVEYNDLYSVAVTGDYQLFSLAISLSDSL